MTKFKVGDTVQDDCGCIYKIKKAKEPFYICSFVDTKTDYTFSILSKQLEARGKAICQKSSK